MRRVGAAAAFLLIACLAAACATAGLSPFDTPDPPAAEESPVRPPPSEPPTPSAVPASPSPETDGDDEGDGDDGESDPQGGDGMVGIDPPVIALTFDDGPSVTTDKVLDKLEEYGVTATFFLIGKQINDKTAASLQRALDMGCEIGNHSWSHSDMKNMSSNGVTDEINRTSKVIEDRLGVYPRFFRAPYLSTSKLMHETIDLTFIQGIACNDWHNKYDAAYRAGKTLEQVRDGVIILLHDFSGNNLTVEALDTIIPELLAQGYRFVTVSELFEIRGVTPKPHSGKAYTDVE